MAEFGNPKLFGELGLGTSQLEADVRKAESLIKELDSTVKTFGERMQQMNYELNLSKLKGEFNKMLDEVKKYADTVGSKIQEGTAKAQSELSRLENIITTFHHVMVGQFRDGLINPDEMLKNIEQVKVILEDTTLSVADKFERIKEYGKKVAIFDEDELTTARTNLNRMKRDVLDTLNKIEEERKSIRKKAQAEAEKHLRDSFQAEMTYNDIAYKEKRITLEQWLRERTRLEQKYGVENLLTQRQLANLSKQEANAILKEQREAEAKAIEASKEIWSQFVEHKNTILRQSTEAQIAQLQKVLQNEQLVGKQRRQAEIELARLKAKHAKEQEAALTRQYELLKGDPSSAKAKFGHISNYLFDATLIYGSIRAVKEMTSTVRELQNASVELAQVIPNATPMDLSDLLDDAFEIGMLTAQNVKDVQTLQNLWARASDEIASSRDAMYELTKVTAMAMNVGGFTDAEDAVQKLNAAINQMGLHWTDAQVIMDSWLKISNITALPTAKDLADVVMSVGAQAKQLGLNIHDLNALAGVFANNMARSGSEIGNALKTIFSYIQRDDTIRTLEKYGIEVKKTANEFHNFQYIMEQINQAMIQFQAANNDRAIRDINEALGRVRRVDYVGVLTQNWNEYQDLLAQSMDSVGYSIEKNEVAMSSLERQLGQLSVVFSRLAWEIGEAGLLEDLQVLVKSGVDLISWINSLNPAIKTAALRIMEFSVAWTMLNKSVNLFTGTGVKQLLLNTFAQWQLNLAKSATSSQELQKHLTNLYRAWRNGAQLSREATLAIQANSLAMANNTQVKMIARRESLVPTLGAETTGVNTHTAVVYRNSQAIMQNIAARRALKQAQMEGVTAQSVLTAGAKALFTSINGWLMLVPAILTAWSSINAHLKAAKERTERLAKAQEELNKVIKKGFVEEYEVPELEEKLGKLEENYERLTQAAEEYQRVQQAMKSVKLEYSYGDGDVDNVTESMARLQVEAGNLQSEMKRTAEALRELGVEGDTVEEILKNAKGVVRDLGIVFAESTNKQRVEVRKLTNDIESYLNKNREVQVLIDRYLELAESIQTAADVTDEFREIVMKLKAAGLADLVSWNDYLQTETLLTKALNERRKAYSGLTEAQKTNLAMTHQLSEATRQAALIEIDILIKKQEALLGVSKAYDKMYHYGTNNVEGYRLLDFYRKLKAEIENLPVYKDVLGDLGGNGTDSGSSSPPYKATVNRYQEIENAIQSVNNELRKMGLLLETVEGQDRIQYLSRQIELYRQEQELLKALNREREKERSETISKLKNMGFSFSGNTVTNYASRLAKLSGDTAKNAEQLLATYYRLTFELIPEAQNKQLELNNTIAKLQDEIDGMNRNIIDNAINLVASIEEKLFEIERKRIEELRKLETDRIKEAIKAEEERHKKRIENLNAEYDAIDEQINLQLKLLDRAEDERQYEKELARLNAEKAELLAKYNELILDDSLEAQAKAAELAEELAKKEEAIDELKHERRLALRRENLQDELEKNRKARENAIKEEDAKFKAEKEHLEKLLKEKEAYYERALQRDALYQEVYRQMTEENIDELIKKVNEFEDEFGKGLSIIGSKIKSELNDNLREAISLIQQLYSSGMTGDFPNMVEQHYQQGNQTVGVREYLQSKGHFVHYDSKTRQTYVDGKLFDMSGFVLQNDQYVGRIADIEKKLRNLGFYATGGIVTQNQLAMLHGSKENWEAVLTKPQIRELMNRVLTDFTLRLPKLSVAQPQPINFSVGTLLNVDGDITSEKLKDAKMIARMVFDELYNEIKKAGVI